MIDEACVRIPRYVKPRVIALSASPLGWRFNLYVGTAVRKVAALTMQVHTDEGFEAFLREKMERMGDGSQMIERVERGLGLWGMRVFAGVHVGRFAAVLYLLLLSALGVCAVGGARMGACAASLCLLWLSVAMEEDYQPVCAGVRQRYLAAVLLRGACMLPLLYSFFTSYARLGVQNNIVLQSAMVVMLFMHLALFFALIAFNKRQPLLLRALAGVLGAVPALTASAALAAVFTASAGTGVALAGAAMGAMGAMLAFAGDQLASLVAIGGLRLKYQGAALLTLTVSGYILMIAGAWLPA